MLLEIQFTALFIQCLDYFDKNDHISLASVSDEGFGSKDLAALLRGGLLAALLPPNPAADAPADSSAGPRGLRITVAAGIIGEARGDPSTVVAVPPFVDSGLTVPPSRKMRSRAA